MSSSLRAGTSAAATRTPATPAMSTTKASPSAEPPENEKRFLERTVPMPAAFVPGAARILRVRRIDHLVVAVIPVAVAIVGIGPILFNAQPATHHALRTFEHEHDENQQRGGDHGHPIARAARES